MDFGTGLLTNLRRQARIAALLGLVWLWSGCGDTFRPVAIPITPVPPDPSGFHYVLSLSVNGTMNPGPGGGPNNPGANPGAATRIDVSGDTNVGVATMGLAPVHAAILPNGNLVYVANSLEDTVSTYPPTDVTKVSTISLGTGAKPIFVATTENATVYVANAGNGTVAVVSASNNVVTNSVGVGFNPVALAETPDAKKVYAVGGTGGVVSINILDKTTNAPVTDANLNSPVWVLARSDSRRVYVLNQGSGILTAIDTSNDAVVPGGDVPVGSGANFMAYDKARNRIYIVNPASTSIIVLDVSVDPPVALPPIDLTAVPAGTTSLCTGPGTCIPTSISVLPDGSRAYVVSYANVTVTDPTTQLPVPATNTQVTVVNTATNSVRTLVPTDPTPTNANAMVAEVDTVNVTGCTTSQTIPSPATASVRFRVFAAAAFDNTHVYISNCDAGGTNIIQTSNDTLVFDSTTQKPLIIRAPASSFGPPNPSAPSPPQNPVFLVTGP